MIYLVSNNKELFDPELYTYISPSAALNMMQEWDKVQFDTETSGRNPHICKILCAQFGNGDVQIVVDTTTIDILLFKEVLETKLIIGVNLKFDYQFLFKHNIIPTNTWDCMIVEQVLFLGFNPKYFHVSLQAIADRRLHIDIDKSIRGEIIWRGLDSRVIVYAAGDVTYLEQIYEQQLKEVKEKKVTRAVDIENRFVICCAYLEWCGIRLDADKWKNEVMKVHESKLKEKLAELNNFVIDLYKNRTPDNGTKLFLVKENNHGYIEEYKLPKDAIPIGPIIEKEGQWGIKEYYRECKVKSNWDKWIYHNLQGDLFSGFNTDPICALNWSSSKQLIPFFQYLGFSTKTSDKKTGETKDSITEKVLAKQKGINDSFLKVYLDYKEAEKICSTYGQNYIDAINPITGRIHTKFKQIGATSSRMSCGGGNKDHDTDLAKYKGIPESRCNFVQLQNLPHDKITRSCFISSPGNLLVAADFSALESRLGADIYQEKEMLEEFLHRSGDMHSLCAKIVFEELKDIPVEKVKELRPDLRTKVKPIEFSQQFGGGVKAVADALGCSKQEATKFVKAYAEGFKGISEFKKKGSAFVRKYGYVLICKHTGLKIFWEDFKKWSAVEKLPLEIQEKEYSSYELGIHQSAAAKWDRMALNSPTQGTGAEIIKLSAIIFFNWILKNGYFGKVLICNMIHDEIVAEFPENLKDIVPKKLKEAMEKASGYLCKSLPIPSVPEVGTYWIH